MIDREQWLIGSILINNSVFEELPAMLPEYFHDQCHQQIWSEIDRMIGKGKPVDPMTLTSRLMHLEAPAGTTWLSYLTSLLTIACSASNAPMYARLIHESWVRRTVKAVCFESAHNIDSDKPAEVINALQSSLEALANNKSIKPVIPMREALLNHSNLMMEREQDNVKFVPTGFTALDDKLGGGFSPGDLVVVAARPSVGKTGLALSMSLNVAKENHVLFFTMEMESSQIIDRATSMVSQVPMSWIRRPATEKNDIYWQRYCQAVTELESYHMTFDETPAQKMNTIRTRSRQINRKQRVDLIVIDYLGLITGSKENNKTNEIGEYTKACKTLAKELGVPVVLLCQLNRGVEQRADKRPLMSDLRDSGDIEQDADTILFLYRDDYYNPDSQYAGVAELNISKQRQGARGTVGLKFDAEFTRFSDLPYEFVRQEETKLTAVRGFK